jgi:hypothetical protein
MKKAARLWAAFVMPVILSSHSGAGLITNPLTRSEGSFIFNGPKTVVRPVQDE